MKQSDLMGLIEAPIISEKSTLSAEKERRLVFRIKRNATKLQVKRAIEAIFNVEVDSVHVLNVKGKIKRFGQFTGTRADWKKAYVKLKPGFDINFTPA